MYMGGGGWAFQDGHQVAIQISHQVDTKHWHFTLTFHKMFEFLEIFVPFLAPPAERQRSFSNTDLSVVRLSVCLSVCPSVRPSVKIEGGRGLSQKRFSNFSSFFGMKLLLGDINHISKDRFGWIALKVIFQGRKGQICLFLHLEVICSKTVQ